MKLSIKDGLAVIGLGVKVEFPFNEVEYSDGAVGERQEKPLFAVMRVVEVHTMVDSGHSDLDGFEGALVAHVPQLDGSQFTVGCDEPARHCLYPSNAADTSSLTLKGSDFLAGLVVEQAHGAILPRYEEVMLAQQVPFHIGHWRLALQMDTCGLLRADLMRHNCAVLAPDNKLHAARGVPVDGSGDAR